MRINMSKFGKFLVSRLAGREALLAAQAYTIPKNTNENIELDFGQVTVITPSWADEFLHGLEDTYGKDKINIVPSENPNIRLVIEALQKQK